MRAEHASSTVRLPPPPAPLMPLGTVSERRGHNWEAVVIGFMCLLFLGLQVCRDDSGKQACRALKETSAFSLLCFSAVRSQEFFLAAVDKASLIQCCHFLPHRGSMRITFTSQRWIWVQTGLSVAWSGLHSAPMNFAAKWLFLGEEMQLSGDQELRFQKVFNLLCLEAPFAEQAQMWSEGSP